MAHLLIVESPTKARTLRRFLGSEDYRIEPTMGHIRDLPKAALGVDVEHDFMPSYVIPRDRMKRVKELRELAEKSDAMILATDPDREGEAIAWHVACVLTDAQVPLKRIVFHEITERAIREALSRPREIDRKLVDAQQARRVLDRLVGYKLSPILWQKLSRRWLSAGRVQSVAVRLIVERERERERFEKSEYWTIEAVFHASHPSSKEEERDIRASLVSKDGIKYETSRTYELFDGTYATTSSTIGSEQSAEGIRRDLKAPYTVSAVEKKEVHRSPSPPYTTSTLQQDAGRRLGFSSKRTMQLAQKLYEEGIITYHRTDSVHVSEAFVTQARAYIKATYGPSYLPQTPRRYRTKSKLAQEAHEAIRPTDAGRTPEQLGKPNRNINRDHHRLYHLIWSRAVASQASDAVFHATTIQVTSGNGYVFETQGSVILRDGFLRILGRDDSGNILLPPLAVGQTVTPIEVRCIQHFTSPPPRYTEASLVKALEEKGIGRPSTYAPIISTIQERMYVRRDQGKLVPTELGVTVTDFLVRYFPTILELPFTARMEDELDAIAQGRKEWQPVIRDFYAPFAADVDRTYREAHSVKLPVEALGEQCPQCGSPLVVRTGRYGKFIACSTFPKCAYSRQLAEKIGKTCPRCGGDIVVKRSRRGGRSFYGCSNWPTCTFASWKKEDIP